jgi:hypothetical protein
MAWLVPRAGHLLLEANREGFGKTLGNASRRCGDLTKGQVC